MAADKFAVALQMATRPYGTFTERRVVEEVARRYRCLDPRGKVNFIVGLAVKAPNLAAAMVRLHGEKRDLHLVNKARAKGKAKGKAMGKAIAGPKARAKGKAKGNGKAKGKAKGKAMGNAKGKAKGKAIAGTKARGWHGFRERLVPTHRTGTHDDDE